MDYAAKRSDVNTAVRQVSMVDLVASFLPRQLGAPMTTLVGPRLCVGDQPAQSQMSHAAAAVFAFSPVD